MNATCPKCGYSVDFDAASCSHCGLEFAKGWSRREPEPEDTPVAAVGAAVASLAGRSRRAAYAGPTTAEVPRSIGYALAALAVAAPVVLARNHGYVESDFGALSQIAVVVGGVLLGAVLLAAIVLLLTRRSSGAVRASAVAVAGLLLACGSVLATLRYDARNEENKRAILAATQEVKEAMLEERRVGASANTPGRRPLPPGMRVPAGAGAPPGVRVPAGASAPPGVRVPAGASAPPVEPGVAGYLRAVAQRVRQEAAEADYINHEFTALDLADVLAAKNLASREGIDRSREKLARFEALLRERGDYLARTMARGEAVIQQATIPQRMRSAALTQFYSRRDRLMPAVHALEKASLALTASAGRVLDFTQGLAGRLSLSGNRLMFQDPNQLLQFRTLMDQVSADARGETAAEERFLAVQREAATVSDALIKRIDQ